jgi:Spy/CpxP family protein refolding chaperone
MKNYLRLFYIVIATALFGVMANIAAADPDSGWFGRMGPGMMGSYSSEYGMGPGMMGLGNYSELNLSAEQKSKVTQIRKEMRAKQWSVMGEMMDAQDKLQELYDTDKQDADAVNKQYKKIEDLRRQMVDNAVDAHNRINEILTKEQREKSKEYGRSYRPMMRGW